MSIQSSTVSVAFEGLPVPTKAKMAKYIDTFGFNSLIALQ